MIFIFDLDGTISCGKNRLHLLPTVDLHLTESWIEFNKACVNDKPIHDTINVMNALFNADHTVIILTGRSDHVKNETVKWLEDNNAHYSLLEMRRASDNRKDTVIKEEFLRKIGFHNITACWDDSPSVIAHFRSLGLTVYQVCDYGDTSLRTDLKSHGVDK